MKKYNFNVLAFVLAAFIFTLSACSGDDGDVGPQGEKGDQGEQGLVGPAGADGSVIYSGEGAPSDEIGIKGDYYFDSTAGLLYGPKKEDGSWTEADNFSLTGNDGADGTDGSKILSGKGAPTNLTGSFGDYYLDSETYTLYGPKSKLMKMSWGIGLVLKGAKGNANVKTFSLTVPAEEWTVLQNTPAYEYKSLSYSAQFQALNKAVFDNGFVLVYWKNGPRQFQLPYSNYTTKQNLLTRTFNIDSNGGEYKVNFSNRLEARTDKSELLGVHTTNYKIVVVSGEAGAALQAARKNPKAFEKLINTCEFE